VQYVHWYIIYSVQSTDALLWKKNTFYTSSEVSLATIRKVNTMYKKMVLMTTFQSIFNAFVERINDDIQKRRLNTMFVCRTGGTEEASIASGSATTRLLGTFQQVKRAWPQNFFRINQKLLEYYYFSRKIQLVKIQMF
jgi:hypothetical protein